MRRAAILLSLAAAGLAGAAAARGAPGLAWTRADGDGRAQILLGVPDTDDIRVAMACTPGSGAVDLTVSGRPSDGALIELRSGKARGRYPGAGIADDEAAGGMEVQARLAVTDPVLARLADTGELTVVLGETKLTAPNAFALEHDFLNVCRAAAT